MSTILSFSVLKKQCLQSCKRNGREGHGKWNRGNHGNSDTGKKPEVNCLQSSSHRAGVEETSAETGYCKEYIVTHNHNINFRWLNRAERNKQDRNDQ